MTSFLLRRAGIPVPPTWVVSSAEHGQRIWELEHKAGHRLVVKPLFGSQGQDLVRLSGNDALPPLVDYGGVYYLQRFVEGQHFDWRVFVINGKAVACMQRYGKHWINNVARGAVCTLAPPDRKLEQLAEAATMTLDMDYAGVDLMRDEHGNFKVIEINGIPAWKGLQSTCDIDVADCLVDDFHRRYMRCQNIAAVSE